MAKKIVNAALQSRMNAIVERKVKKAAASPAPKGADKKKWFDLLNAEKEEADIYIYDEISDSPWYGYGAQDLVDALGEVKAKTLNVHLNSPGGSVFTGFAIYSGLVSWAERKSAKINVVIDGWAASIASVIAMAGDHISIGEHAAYMVHSPWSWCVGDSEAMRAEADILDELEETIIDIYVARTNGDREEITAWVKNETWMKGKLAVERGFADEIIPLKKKKEDDDEAEDSAQPAASHDADYFSAIFPNMPQDVREALTKQPANENKALPTTTREFKDFLREHGFSGKQADAIAGNGFKTKTEPRDEAVIEPEKPTTPERRDDAGKRDEALVSIRRAAALAAIRAA